MHTGHPHSEHQYHAESIKQHLALRDFMRKPRRSSATLSSRRLATLHRLVTVGLTFYVSARTLVSGEIPHRSNNGSDMRAAVASFNELRKKAQRSLQAQTLGTILGGLPSFAES